MPDMYAVDGSVLTDIADAIRLKTDSAAPIAVEDMAHQISMIETGGGGDDAAVSIIERTFSVLANNKATRVGDYAFVSCSTLTSIDLPAVTTIGREAFASCSGLTSVNLPAVETINRSAFRNCTSLESLNIPVVTSIDISAFAFCSSLTSINLPAITVIGNYAFASCLSLTSINLPAVKDIRSNAFFNCRSLVEVSLPVVEQIRESAFAFCSSLTSINLPAASSININAFGKCSLLSYINIPAVNVLYQIFDGCTSLTTVVIGTDSCILNNINNFANTPLASGIGSILVPASRVDYYKTSKNWSNYADCIFPITEE